ncbi:MAG TPA: hypothetical protein VKQ32_05775, partial [Polyangia bacterium]|nr:hypothetical protein [Polyangia bacterium]
MAALLVAACQGPDELFRGQLDGGGFDVPTIGRGGTTGGGGSGPGAGGMPTGLGGNGPGSGGSVGAAGS